MGDARRRAIEIADLKATSPRVEAVDNTPEFPMTVEHVFSTDRVMDREGLKGAPNWVSLKERNTRFGDTKHKSGNGAEQAAAVIDNQRFDVSAAVTKRLAEKAKAEAAATNTPGIATGLSDVQQEVVSEQAPEGLADLLREDKIVGVYVDQQADIQAALDNDQPTGPLVA